MAASETLSTEQPNMAADGDKRGGLPRMASSETLRTEQPYTAADGNKRGGTAADGNKRAPNGA